VNDSEQWLPFGLGIFTGMLALILALLLFRRRIVARYEKTRERSDSTTEILEFLAPSALIINDVGLVVRATQGAFALGVLQNRFLVHQELKDLVARARESDSPESIELEIKIGMQNAVAYTSSRAVLLDDGNVLLIVDDKTEAKRLDDTRRDFIANISHELKTPIGAIGLLAEALGDAAGDPEAISRFSKSLVRESKRLADLVQDIIQLSRIQSAEVVASAELVEVAPVIIEAIDRNSFQANRRGVKISHSAPNGIFVIGDAEMITAAVKNLIENAILYSPEGSSVGVGLRSVDEIVEITVTDSGIGISKEEQDRIFERFYRVDPSRSRETGGTGLGLSIVKHVAQIHHGEIKLFSSAGVGSTFTLRIPEADKNIVVSDSDRSES
jgi:two-component system sensor histidine kinase SenX3